ncbi:MAG: recT [Gemmatimonadetes bacterium]|nr:recT [Gemmatimonadota bacterium]
MGTSLAVAPAQKTLKDLLTKATPSLQAVMPRHINAEKLIKIALLATSRTPLLLECTPSSILQSVMQAAQLGLEVNSPLGSAYLVPFKNRGVYECQLIPGYRGLIDLARRSGGILLVDARVVYDSDVFAVEQGTDPRIVHSPRLSADREYKNIIAFYATALLPGNVRQFEVMSKAEVDAIRARSKASGSGPWVSDYAEMGRKTVVKRLVKYLPLSPELAAAVELDNRAETGEVGGVSDILDTAETVEAIVVSEAKSGTGTNALRESLAKHLKNGSDDGPAAPAPDAANDADTQRSGSVCEACGGKDGKHETECPYY